MEDLVTFPCVREAITAAKVSDIFCFSVNLSILSTITKFIFHTHTHTHTHTLGHLTL